MYKTPHLHLHMHTVLSFPMVCPPEAPPFFFFLTFPCCACCLVHNTLKCQIDSQSFESVTANNFHVCQIGKDAYSKCFSLRRSLNFLLFSRLASNFWAYRCGFCLIFSHHCLSYSRLSAGRLCCVVRCRTSMSARNTSLSTIIALVCRFVSF